MDAILGLIDRIYEAGANPEQWRNALAGLADATGMLDATMGGQTPAEVPVLISARTDPEQMQSYVEHYHAGNTLQLALRTTPVGQAVVDAQVIDIKAFRGSAFYNEWCLPQNYRHGAALNVATAQGWRATLMISGRSEVGQEQLQILDAVAPHLIRAFQLNQVLQDSQALARGAFAALEYMDRGALLVGSYGTVRTANALAETLLEQGDGLLLQHGRLTCNNGVETAALGRLVAQCARGIVPGNEGTMQVTRRNGRSPLTVQVLPFPASYWWPGFSQQWVMIFVSDPDARMVQATERLRQRFGLTPAEARLAWEIVRGGGRKAAAASRGISVATARSQLTSIFDKTGVRRQSELVRLLLDD